MARYISVSSSQIEALLNFMDDHRDLARSKLRSVEGKVKARELWKELCYILNAMGGCTKSVQQWQKVWFDRKHLARKASAESSRTASEAIYSCRPTPAHLSKFETRILDIIGHGTSSCQPQERVPAFSESSSDPISPSRASPSSITETVEVAVESKHDPGTFVTWTSTQEPLPPRKSQRPSLRRRRPVPGNDINSRLLRIEEQRSRREAVRNSELAGIRAALKEMCGLMKRFLDSP